MTIRPAPDAVATFESWPTYPPRLCLNAQSRVYQHGDATHSSTDSPLFNATSATDHWNKTDAAHKVPGGRNAPAGALYQCVTGQGHIFMSLGGGRARSTDFPSVGKIGEGTLQEILDHFPGNEFVGYVTAINGRPIEGLVEETTSAPSGGSLQDVYARVQRALAARGRYQGPDDGAFGPNTWRGIQFTVSTKNRNTYAGPIDGIPGPKTLLAVQKYAKAYGDYEGPLDGAPGINTWNAFALGLERP